MIMSNIPMLVSACFMGPIYHSQYFDSHELFVRFMETWSRKCYNIKNITKILYQLKKNEGIFMLTWNSGLSYIY